MAGVNSVSSPLCEGSVAGVSGPEVPAPLSCAPAPVSGGPERGPGREALRLCSAKTGRSELVQTAEGTPF